MLGVNGRGTVTEDKQSCPRQGRETRQCITFLPLPLRIEQRRLLATASCVCPFSFFWSSSLGKSFLSALGQSDDAQTPSRASRDSLPTRWVSDRSEVDDNGGVLPWRAKGDETQSGGAKPGKRTCDDGKGTGSLQNRRRIRHMPQEKEECAVWRLKYCAQM